MPVRLFWHVLLFERMTIFEYLRDFSIKLSTQLTMHTHPSAGVFNLLKFALSHKEKEKKDVGHGEMLMRMCRF